jgi:hypothetical protein
MLPGEHPGPIENPGTSMDVNCLFLSNDCNTTSQEEIIPSPPISVSLEEVSLSTPSNSLLSFIKLNFFEQDIGMLSYDAQLGEAQIRETETVH